MPVKKESKTVEKKTAAKAKVVAPKAKSASKKVEVEAKKVTFKLSAPDAGSVFVAGDFNNWDATQAGLKKNTKGEWSSAFALKPGTYQYKFVIDGNWVADQSAETVTDNSGNLNNVKVVK